MEVHEIQSKHAFNSKEYFKCNRAGVLGKVKSMSYRYLVARDWQRSTAAWVLKERKEVTIRFR